MCTTPTDSRKWVLVAIDNTGMHGTQKLPRIILHGDISVPDWSTRMSRHEGRRIFSHKLCSLKFLVCSCWSLKQSMRMVLLWTTWRSNRPNKSSYFVSFQYQWVEVPEVSSTEKVSLWRKRNCKRGITKVDKWGNRLKSKRLVCKETDKQTSIGK